MKKCFKILSVIAVMAILCAPATALAKGPRFSFSFNFFDAVPLCAPPPPPPPIIEEHVYVPCPPPPPVYVERETIVREYHPYCGEVYVQRPHYYYPY